MMQFVRSDMQMAYPSPRRRGIAIMTCLIMIGFIGIAVAAMAAHLSADAGRTRTADEDAQARQLLTFAAVDLQQRLPRAADDSIEEPVEFALPRALTGNGTKVAATRLAVQADRLEYRITATIETRGWSQVVVYQKTDNNWAMTEATLDRRTW